jgi:hypothetical protein
MVHVLDHIDVEPRVLVQLDLVLHYNEHRKLALVGCETEEYDRLARRPQVSGTAVYAYRNRRAQ